MGDYAVLADVHTRLTDLSTDYDALISELCTEATKIFTRETGRRFDATTATLYFSGNGKRKLFVPDLAAVTTIRARSSTSGSWRSMALTPAEGNRLGDVVLGPERRDTSEPAGWLRIIDFPAGSDRTWPDGDATVEINGTWGYASVPVDVKDACIELVVSMLRDRGVATGTDTGGGSFGEPIRPRTYPDITYRAMRQRRTVLVA